jgi:hypothetical protein
LPAQGPQDAPEGKKIAPRRSILAEKTAPNLTLVALPWPFT